MEGPDVDGKLNVDWTELFPVPFTCQQHPLPHHTCEQTTTTTVEHRLFPRECGSSYAPFTTVTDNSLVTN